MKRLLYLMIMTALLLSMLTVPASAKKGSGMYVSAMSGTYAYTEDGIVYTVYVTIVDEFGNLLVGAKVNAKVYMIVMNGNWMYQPYSAITNGSGVATFNVPSHSRTFNLTVENVLKAGYVYMPELNVVDSIWLGIEPL